MQERNVGAPRLCISELVGHLAEVPVRAYVSARGRPSGCPARTINLPLQLETPGRWACVSFVSGEMPEPEIAEHSRVTSEAMPVKELPLAEEWSMALRGLKPGQMQQSCQQHRCV